jgi:hypothetical protein
MSTTERTSSSPLFFRDVAFGHNLVTRNSDDSFEIPVPATLLVDGQGIVRNTYINPHYWERVEPSTVLEWIDES